MPLQQRGQIDQIEGVTTEAGEKQPAANAPLQQQMTDSLGNFAAGIDGTASDDGSVSALPAQPIPDGVEVAVQADPGNSGKMIVGLTSNPTIALQPGRSISYRPSNLSQIRIQATESGDSVNFTAEVTDG